MREPARTVHRNADGTSVFSYVPGTDASQPAAYAIEVIGPGAVESILTDLSGWTVSGPIDLATELVAAGASVRRRFHFMRRSLTSDRPPAAWSESDLGADRREVPCDRAASELFGAWHAAYSAP